MNKGQRNEQPRKFKMTEEQKGQMKVFFEAVKAYKKEQTPENKAKLVELIGKNYDKRIAMQEKRVADMKKAAEIFEKKTVEMKANRNAEIEKSLQRITNPQAPRFKMGHRKNAPAAPAAK